MPSKLVKKLLGLAAATVTLTALCVPIATPAQAAPVERGWVMKDKDHDGYSGLFFNDGVNADTIGGGSTVVEAESPTTDVTDLSTSADGTRVIYVDWTYIASKRDWKSEIVVRDTDLRLVRVLESRYLFATRTDMSLPQLSPDGTKAMWLNENIDSNAFVTRKALVGYGAATNLGGSLLPYSFLTNELVLLQTGDGTAYTFPYVGGTKTAVPGIPKDAFSVRISPAGDRLVWCLLTSKVLPATSTLQVAPLTLTGATATVGPPMNLDATSYNRQPTFSRDGATIRYLKTNGRQGGTGDVWQLPSDGSGFRTAIAITTTDERDFDVTDVPSTDTTVPGPVTMRASVLSGTSIRPQWTLPTDPDISGVLLTSQRPGGVQKTTYVPAPQSSALDTGLPLGATITYTVKVVDRYGIVSSGATAQAQAVGPGIVYGEPTSSNSTTAAFPVSFAAAATPSNVLFDVEYLPPGSSTWTPWVTHTTGRARFFGVAGSTNVAPTTSTPGKSYTFRVKVTDVFGNSSAWVGKGRAVVPFDQTWATYGGGTNITDASAYLGSYRQLANNTQWARLRVWGNLFQLVGMRCPTCGKFVVYDNVGNPRGTVDTYASTTQVRQVLIALKSNSQGELFTIVPLSTPGRPRVMVDGFGIRT